MPKISQAYQTIKISLPSYSDSEIEIKTNVSVGEIVESEKSESGLEKAIFLAARMITKWNFQDDNENDIPISQENIKLFPASDLEFLLDKITPYMQKKTPSEKTS